MIWSTRLKSFCRLVTWVAVIVLPLNNFAFCGDQPGATGEQIYRQKCAVCHGASGEGTEDHYPRPLIGERPVASLARLIAKTMPEDAPGDCVGEDAQRVAAYIYQTFYSKDAQARNKFRLPRIELSRLTVRQYRNAVTDLIGGFRNPGRWDQERGLKGEYSGKGRADVTEATAARSIALTRRSVSSLERAARSRSRTLSRKSPKGGKELHSCSFP